MKKKITLMLFAVSLISLVITSGVSYGQQYVIGADDVLHISVWANPDLNLTVPVRPDGMISFPLVGDVRAAGMSTKELKALLEKELSNFVKAPNVSVIVDAVNSFKVYVVGEGNAGRPGVLTLKQNSSLVQVLAQIGFDKSADLEGSYVLRKGKKLGNNLLKLIEGDMSQDIQMEPDDVIFIPGNFKKRILVVGAVKNPRILDYREGMTALDAVLSAGGFTEFAKQNDVIVVRKTGGEVKRIEVRLKDVIKDGDISKDVPLKPGDLITVTSGIF